MNLDPGDSVGGFISKALPWIGAIATGNIPGLIGLAANQIGAITGSPVPATQAGITAAVTGITDPETMLKMKQVDADLAAHMKQMGFADAEEFAKLAQDDRNSARQRDSDIVKAQGHNYRADILAYLAIIAVGFAGYALAVMDIPANNREMLIALISMLTMIVKDIYGFEFSTTRDSQTKGAALAGIATGSAGTGS